MQGPKTFLSGGWRNSTKNQPGSKKTRFPDFRLIWAISRRLEQTFWFRKCIYIFCRRSLISTLLNQNGDVDRCVQSQYDFIWIRVIAYTEDMIKIHTIFSNCLNLDICTFWFEPKWWKLIMPCVINRNNKFGSWLCPNPTQKYGSSHRAHDFCPVHDKFFCDGETLLKWVHQSVSYVMYLSSLRKSLRSKIAS